MTLKAKLMMFTAAVTLSATMATAAITTNDLVKSYQDANFTAIEVTEGPSQIKVEAIKNGVKLEIVYDKATGAVVKRESRNVKASDRPRSGVEINSSSDDDFSNGRSDDDRNDDRNDDHGNDDDHGRDGSDDSNDDDNGRHGSDDDHGDDHDSNGSDDSSNDSDDDN